MANYAYLCCTDHDVIYPSAVIEDYDASISTVAADVHCVPLLWLALFRVEDFYEETFEREDGELTACAPLLEKSRALANLAEARTWYRAAFAGLGALDEHFDLFERAVREAPGAYVTIELEEIACLHESEAAFYEDFAGLLAALAEPPDEEAAEAMLELAAYRAPRPFPPARMWLDDPAFVPEPDDAWNHCRIFGAGAVVAGFGRPAPWEARE